MKKLPTTKRAFSSVRTGAGALVVLASVLLPTSAARAFCGFYVSGATAPKNRGSLVILMRDGTRTVVSMQNDYQGPAEAFAMVVPVPEVLSEDQVRTLPREVFERVDTMAAPRLVEYWEQDPCYADARRAYQADEVYRSAAGVIVTEHAAGVDEDYGVTVEAQFAVGEYDIEILGASDSDGLERWLRDHDYRIPSGAAAVLAPYIQQGMRFFVARVDPARVEFADGQAILSPLRFHYDSESFSLPIRLGRLSADGPQDVVVHILARQNRYEVANYDNYAIPTNLRVTPEVRANFGAFYDQLFQRVSEHSDRAVITEYAWSAGSCDPCPGPTLDDELVATLGADVTPSYARAIRRGRVYAGFAADYVLTRLHMRYGNDLGEDLVFRTAPPIEGGRGTPDGEGQMSPGARAYAINNFQARYAILHRWEGDITCDEPVRGRWGGPPNGGSGLLAAAGLAFAAPSSNANLQSMLDGPQPALGQDPLPTGEQAPAGPPTLPPGAGCARCGVGAQPTAPPFGWAFATLLVGFAVRRRRR